MLTAVVLEGLQDLLLQYLQLKLEFVAKDQAMLFVIYGGFLNPPSPYSSTHNGIPIPKYAFTMMGL
jgi:hypothetical protein